MAASPHFTHERCGLVRSCVSLLFITIHLEDSVRCYEIIATASLRLSHAVAVFMLRLLAGYNRNELESYYRRDGEDKHVQRSCSESKPDLSTHEQSQGPFF
jgi:hypothetical protein